MSWIKDSEARIEHLRERAGGHKRNKKTGDPAVAAGGSSQALHTTSGGHINFFADLEHVSKWMSFNLFY